MILYIELKLINKFNKATGHKINMLLYTNSKLSENEMKKTIQFIITSKTRKYLSILT